MNLFNYEASLSQLMTPRIMNAVASVHEYRGKQRLYEQVKPDILEKLCEVAIVQSTGASNRIENIQTSEARLRALMAEKVRPKNRDEHEIVGYRHVLDLIHTSYEHIPVTPNVILQLHRDLYRGLDVMFAGRWKDADNSIAERLPSGGMAVRFRPTSAIMTPSAIDSLCENYCKSMEAGTYDSLLIALMFIFDFVSIHPFNDGNGRMSRLLTLLLLYKGGYQVGRYVSIEKEIEDTKGSYYDALKASSYGWGSGESDYTPFIEYMLGVVLASYKELDRRVELADESGTYEDAVRSLFDKSFGAMSKREIMDGVAGMSRATAERVLQKLQAEGLIEKVGAARATRYRLKG